MQDWSSQPFWSLSEGHPSKPALILPSGAQISYASLSDLAQHYADLLIQAAQGRRPLVSLDFATSPAAIAAYLGALRAGLPLLLNDPARSSPGGAEDLPWRPDLRLRAESSGQVTLDIRPDWQADGYADAHPDLRLLLSTSGSTGDPKLVRLSGQNIASNAAAIMEYLKITPADRAATCLPLFYSYGMSVLNSHLAAGASLVLSERSINTAEFWHEGRELGVTSLALVPHQFDLLRQRRFQGNELPKLRYITQAGGRLAPDAATHFNELGRKNRWGLVLMYGQTEAGPRISYVPPSALPEAASTIGHAIPGGRIWLEDAQGEVVQTLNTQGELIYEGPNVMMGYAFQRADLALPAGPPVLRTGDLAEKTEAGYYRITGRLSRFAKLFGLRVSLDRIEADLQAELIPSQAVAVGDELVLLLADPSQAEEALSFIASRYKLPSDGIVTAPLGEMPLLPSGKTDHKALARRAAQHLAQARTTPSTLRQSESLTALMARATRTEIVRPEDSFLGLGGDSLSALSVQIILEERLGHLPANWEKMPIAELEALARPPTTRRRTTTLSGDIVLRVLAVAMIVAQHASDYTLYGGTWILLAVMGVGMARFQREQIRQGQAGTLLWRMLTPIVPLYFILLAAYATLREEPPLTYWFLLGNYQNWSSGSLLVVYWFVSLYAQIIVFLCLVSCWPRLRLIVANRPWAAAAGCSTGILLSLSVLALVQSQWGLAYQPQRGFPEGLSVVLLGWMIHTMSERRQIVLTTILGVATLAALSSLDMTAQVRWVLGASLLLLALEAQLSVPHSMATLFRHLGSATLYVYLTHQILIHALDKFGLSDPMKIAVALPASFALGIGLRQSSEWLWPRLLQPLRRVKFLRIPSHD